MPPKDICAELAGLGNWISLMCRLVGLDMEDPVFPCLHLQQIKEEKSLGHI